MPKIDKRFNSDFKEMKTNEIHIISTGGDDIVLDSIKSGGKVTTGIGNSL